ncbi:MAG: indole-3-glycerol phosphate synthase TrpC, partial [Candidatus Dormibacteria bacterium]
AISVLTEEDQFHGSLADLDLARSGCQLPLLRKDFLSRPYQVVQSAAHGADAVLAIVAGLAQPELEALVAEARRWRLEVLVEVHDEEELELALRLSPELLGINNRNLRTLELDLATTARLRRLVPPGTVVVSESGLRRPEEVRALLAQGIECFLVGEALLRTEDPVGWLKEAASATAVSRP